MAEIFIDGEKYQVKDGDNILQACLQLGFDLPYFCWHPAMGSVGACRQCAVIQYQDENDERGRIVMSCMTPVTDGAYFSVSQDKAKKFRSDVVEVLMSNHPHDCPVCEEGGECHLQDMTVMAGHTSRRFRGEKRTHNNQYLGPFIKHEMNRCIACYRCVRYYDDYAGGNDLQVMSSRNQVFFGRQQDGILESEFSGNLVEVCPTGVFTDKTFSNSYNRKWDLQTAPSICVGCSLGCNTNPGERNGELKRIVNRYHGEVNGYFLCDRGRFGYDFVNHEKRARYCVVQGKAVTNSEAVSAIDFSNQVVGIGSPRASVEANFALQQLVGKNNFYTGLSAREHKLIAAITDIYKQRGVQAPSLKDIEKADVVLILGEDLTQTAPRMALSVRQAARNKSFILAEQARIPRWQDAAVRNLAQDQKSPIYIASLGAGKLDDVAEETFYGAADDIARIGFAVAHALNPDAPAVVGLNESERQLVESIKEDFRLAERPLVIAGTSCDSLAIIDAASNVARALDSHRSDEFDIALSFVLPECNSMGLGLLNLDEQHQGRTDNSVSDVIKKVLSKTEKTTAIVLENDLYRREDAVIVDEFINSVDQLIVIDYFENTTSVEADVFLPSGTFAETEGTLVNNEGRAQRSFSVVIPQKRTQDNWRWLSAIARVHADEQYRLQALAECEHFDEIIALCSKSSYVLNGLVKVSPTADYRVAGLKIPRQPHRYSGRTSMRANKNVHEPKQEQDADTALSYSMEGSAVNAPASMTPLIWSPAWNSNEAVNKFQDEISGSLKGGDGGINILDALPKVDQRWFHDIPKQFIANVKSLMAMPVYHIFGSDELSVLSPSINERALSACLVMNADDAEHYQISNSDWLEVDLRDTHIKLPVIVSEKFSKGVLGVPAVVHSQLPVNEAYSCKILPATVTVKKVNL